MLLCGIARGVTNVLQKSKKEVLLPPQKVRISQEALLMPACINFECPYHDDFRDICTIAGTDEDFPLIEDDDLISDIPEDD